VSPFVTEATVWAMGLPGNGSLVDARRPWRRITAPETVVPAGVATEAKTRTLVFFPATSGTPA
jgi:hypothetical protein